MADLSDLVTQTGVIAALKAQSKKQLLQELAHRAAQITGLAERTIFETLLERERLGTTGVGHGIAIPHGKLAGLDDILVCFGRSREGVDFDAIDNRPVHLFVLLLSPAATATEYLRALAGISRMLKHNGNRERLFDSISKEEILALFAGEPEAR